MKRNDSKNPDAVLKVIATALAEKGALPADDENEEGPLEQADVVDLMGGYGILKAADHRPAVDMTPKGGYTMEQVRRAGLDAGRRERANRRQAAARARADRKKQYEDLAVSPDLPNPARTAAAWLVILPLEPIIEATAQSKKAWAARLIGSVVDDVAQQAMESSVVSLARSDKDLGLLRQAAEELGRQQQDTGKVPGDQRVPESEEARKERKEVAKARKWLMGLVNNRVMGALTDAYTDQKNLRWEVLDVLPAVLAGMSGPEGDAFLNSHKASKSIAPVGGRFALPGRVDPNLLATAISAAITAHRLDPLVEVLIDADYLRTDGSFAWSRHSREVFLASPVGGEELWGMVCSATEHVANPRHARADAARTHVRHLFEWLPTMVVNAVQAFEPEPVCRVVASRRIHVVMRSTLDTLMLHEETTRQYTPALTFATPRQAAQALAEHLPVVTDSSV